MGKRIKLPPEPVSKNKNADLIRIESDIEKLNQEIEEATRVLVAERSKKRRELDKLRDSLTIGAIPVEDSEGLTDAQKVDYLIHSGYWNCPESPTGKCVYFSLSDPCHDDCLFCHDPEERK